VQGPPVNKKYVQGPQNMWLLDTLEALAPLLVALAHVQVALEPIFYLPDLWPLHLESVYFRPLI
jgi:hypothetical protein